MVSDITIGQYFPGRSLIHKLDPRIKIILTFSYIVMTFTASSAYSLGFMAAILIFMILLSAISVKIVFKAIKPMIPVILFTSFLNVFYGKGDYIFSYLFLHVSRQGLISASFLSVRIVCLITCSSLLTYTTSMNLLADGLEELMSPLNKFNVPVNEISMMITLALRFIPTLTEEIDKIINAQKSRGADFDKRGIIRRIKSYFPIIIPLFMSSFRRAYELTNAIECRCYNGGKGRTKMRSLHTERLDYAAVSFFAFIFIIVIYLNKF